MLQFERCQPRRRYFALSLIDQLYSCASLGGLNEAFSQCTYGCLHDACIVLARRARDSTRVIAAQGQQAAERMLKHVRAENKVDIEKRVSEYTALQAQVGMLSLL